MMMIRSLAETQCVVVCGIAMTVQGDDTGYGSLIGLCLGRWKAMNPAAGQGTNRPFSGPSTKSNELFHSTNILLYSVLALCE